jgi:hypothetical protein
MPRVRRKGHSKARSFERDIVRWLRKTDRPLCFGDGYLALRDGPNSAHVVDRARGRFKVVVINSRESAHVTSTT